jgi:hypothetical protein
MHRNHLHDTIDPENINVCDVKVYAQICDTCSFFDFSSVGTATGAPPSPGPLRNLSASIAV